MGSLTPSEELMGVEWGVMGRAGGGEGVGTRIGM